MKTAILVASVVTMLPSHGLWAQNSAANDPIRVVLPAAVESRSCQFQYFLVGPFGGYGGFARAERYTSAFEIETVHEGAAAEHLKTVLYCAGYQLQTMTFDSLPPSAGRNVQVNLQPLGTVPFLGLVQGLTPQNGEALYVDVDYTPSWVCEFFRLLDCGLATSRIASVKLEPDGRFTAALPDFVRDAAISESRVRANSLFVFAIRRRGTRCSN